MLIKHNLYDKNKLNSSIIAIGNYDGVHLGHQHILNKMFSISNSLSIPTVLLTFEPHTNDIIFKKPTKLLTNHS